MSCRSVSDFFQLQNSMSEIEAESRWALYLAKQNLAFLSNEHDTNLVSTALNIHS